MATNSDLFEKVVNDEIKFHELDKLVGEKKAAEIRLKVLEKKLNLELENIKSSILNPENCKPNIENMIGSAQVPLGIAGPVKVKGEFAEGDFYLPLSTTEGALVASVNRGCNVINKSGGAETVILKNEQTRSILFKVNSVKESKKFSDWVKNNFDELKKIGEKDEKFLSIKGIEIYVVGLNIWLRIKGDTNDAMGMNMVTIAGKKIADHITQNYDNVTFISETGNLCVDKKPSAMNLINSRGKRVIASVNIQKNIIEQVLRTTPEKLIEMNYRKNLLGSAAAGALAFNAHFANIIAAMFIATGQDVAHTVNGSLGFTTVESSDKGVNFSITLTDLHVGTVGGGTGLKTQKECLNIVGVAGPGNPPGNNSKKLAEIVATAVLAGEISLLGALCSKDLSKAHQNLNR